MIFLGIMFIAIGIFMLLKRNDKKKLFNKLEKGQTDEYEETVGTVICDAYEITGEVDEQYARVTPIVEYEVNGEKYEGQNEQLSSKGELPVGFKMKVWYRKDNPRDYILQTELKSYNDWIIWAIICIIIGGLFILLNVYQLYI